MNYCGQGRQRKLFWPQQNQHEFKCKLYLEYLRRFTWQPFAMGDHHYISQILLSLNQPNSMDEICHFILQNIGFAGLPLRHSVSLFVLFCDLCVLKGQFRFTEFSQKHKQANGRRQQQTNSSCVLRAKIADFVYGVWRV